MLHPLVPFTDSRRLMADAFDDAFVGLIAGGDRPQTVQAGWGRLTALGVTGMLAEDTGLGAFEAGLLVQSAAKAEVAAPVKEMLWSTHVLAGVRAAAGMLGGDEAVTCVAPTRPVGLPDTGLVTLREVTFGAHARWVACPLRAQGSDGAVHIALLDRSLHAWTCRPGVRLAGQSDAVDICVQADVLRASIVPELVIAGDAWQRLLQLWLTLVVAQQSGVCEGARAKAVEYLEVRRQFGRFIGSFQALRALAVRGLVVSQDVNLAWQYAAQCWDGRDRDSHRAAVTAVLCAEPVRAVVEDVIQMHGGVGFTWELGLHRRLNQAIEAEFACGDYDAWAEALLREADANDFASIDNRFLEPLVGPDASCKV